MKAIRTIILTLVAITCLQSRAHASVATADSLYNAGNFQQALDEYLAVADSLGTSADLLYNIGNSYYRLDELGNAIVYYERALKLDATHGDARANLEFVNTRIADRPTDDRSLPSRLYDSCLMKATANTWAIVAMVLFVVLVCAVVGYLVFGKVKIRKICFFGGIVVLVADVFVLSLALDASSQSSATDQAIIITPAAELTTAPRHSDDAAGVAFRLHEGTKVQIVDSIAAPDHADTWYEVKVAGQSRAWTQGRNLVII